jgi:hypothetical protein
MKSLRKHPRSIKPHKQTKKSSPTSTNRCRSPRVSTSTKMSKSSSQAKKKKSRPQNSTPNACKACKSFKSLCWASSSHVKRNGSSRALSKRSSYYSSRGKYMMSTCTTLCLNYLVSYYYGLGSRSWAGKYLSVFVTFPQNASNGVTFLTILDLIGRSCEALNEYYLAINAYKRMMQLAWFVESTTFESRSFFALSRCYFYVQNVKKS